MLQQIFLQCFALWTWSLSVISSFLFFQRAVLSIVTYIINSLFLIATSSFFPEYPSKLKSLLCPKIHYPSLFIFVTAGSNINWLFLSYIPQTALCLITQVTDKDTKQSCPSYRSRRGVTLTAGLWTADQYSLSPAMKPAFHPPYYALIELIFLQSC